MKDLTLEEREELFKKAQKDVGISILFQLEDKKDNEFTLCFDTNEKRFYFTLVGDNPKALKKLLKKALKDLERGYSKNKLSLDDIYDVTSLTSASNIFNLCQKMRLILYGC